MAVDVYLLAKLGSEIDWLRAAIDFLVGRCAVAARIVCLTVKDFAAIARGQSVVACGKRVAPFRAELI